MRKKGKKKMVIKREEDGNWIHENGVSINK
jgi:hypothetical protein